MRRPSASAPKTQPRMIGSLLLLPPVSLEEDAAPEDPVADAAAAVGEVDGDVEPDDGRNVDVGSIGDEVRLDLDDGSDVEVREVEESSRLVDAELAASENEAASDEEAAAASLASEATEAIADVTWVYTEYASDTKNPTKSSVVCEDA